jgi:hypothetical protein
MGHGVLEAALVACQAVLDAGIVCGFHKNSSDLGSFLASGGGLVSGGGTRFGWTGCRRFAAFVATVFDWRFVFGMASPGAAFLAAS